MRKLADQKQEGVRKSDIPNRLPAWLRNPTQNTNAVHHIKKQLRQMRLHTVCEEAKCPNLGECFANHVATFLIMGPACTRNCRFCAIDSSVPGTLNFQEPIQIARQIAMMSLAYVVITSVTRDDLPDGGADHFCQTISAIRDKNGNIPIEVLIPDFNGDISCISKICDAQPYVINHNIETIDRLTPHIRSKATYDRSLSVLAAIKKLNIAQLTKSGLMVGLGETDDEVFKVMDDLKSVDCDIMTIGQYLPPSRQHVNVKRYVHPDIFEQYEDYGKKLGFHLVIAKPLCRSSYMAEHALTLKGPYFK